MDVLVCNVFRQTEIDILKTRLDKKGLWAASKSSTLSITPKYSDPVFRCRGGRHVMRTSALENQRGYRSYNTTTSNTCFGIHNSNRRLDLQISYWPLIK